MADGSQEITVRPGETIILEIAATPSNGAVTERSFGAGTGETGSLEIQMLDEKGDPTHVGPLYLVAKNGEVIEVKIDSRGVGAVESLPVGDYEVTLQKPVDDRLLGNVGGFAPASAKLPADALAIITKILATIRATQQESGKGSYTYTLILRGYADNTPGPDNRKLSENRAFAVKKAIEAGPKDMPWLYLVCEGKGELPGDSEVERKTNRRVDLVLRIRPRTRT